MSLKNCYLCKYCAVWDVVQIDEKVHLLLKTKGSEFMSRDGSKFHLRGKITARENKIIYSFKNAF